MMHPISACVITYNEEENIHRLLSSLDFVDEIVILDSGSEDQTLSIASEFSKVKIFHRNFDDYINQKNHCIDLALNDWVLSLDADEEVSQELKFEILSLGKSSEAKGYEIPRLTFYLGKWIYHGGWYPNLQLRFFNKKYGRFVGKLVHEKVVIQERISILQNPILHYSYKNISDHLDFINKYSGLFALEKHRKEKKASVFLAFGKAVYKFFNMYFIKKGFLDGRAGFIIAILGFTYNFLKYIKIYELSITDKTSRAPEPIRRDRVHDDTLS
ncbi:MAG: glycosyltransferase family 2 protein [Leptospiraceae bacterium]|nr:glycosyltransferase family 2 protein [Leptospiraceae bacterium]